MYLLDGKCVGIAGISEEEAEVYNTYIKAVEDGTLTFLSGGAEYEITMDASEKAWRILFFQMESSRLCEKKNRRSVENYCPMMKIR